MRPSRGPGSRDCYTHRLTREVDVLLTSDSNPVCWTHTVGHGRVAYLSLGHCTGAFTHPSVRSTIQHLWAWTGGRRGNG
ncbi:MAG: ThuA domain-containing protein [Spirochaetaceae bacterium]